MKLTEPKRWIALLCVVTAIVLAIRWGLRSWAPTDFYRLHDWAGLWLTLATVCVTGGALWAFYALFPSVLHESRIVSNVLAGVLFFFAFAAVAGLAVGINRLGERLRPTEMIATLTDYKTHRRASNASSAGHFCVFRVANGPTLDVPVSVVDKLRLKIGDEVPVLLHQGNVYDWGWLEPLRPPD